MTFDYLEMKLKTFNNFGGNVKVEFWEELYQLFKDRLISEGFVVEEEITDPRYFTTPEGKAAQRAYNARLNKIVDA